MADIVKQILAKPIQLADQVTKAADEAIVFKQECAELKSKTEKLAAILRQAVRASSDLYERPTRRIIDDTEQVLDKALALALKCNPHGMQRILTILPARAFRKMSSKLEYSIRMSWLLRVSASAYNRDDEYLGLPPIAANEAILCLIWEQIAILYTGSIEDRSDAAASLVSLARDNDLYRKLIIEEGGVGPLLKLVEEGRVEGQESAARAIGLLGRDPESVEHMIHAGVCSVFAKILKEGPMKVQAVVAWAVSELAANYPKCQDPFAQHNIIRLLVSHLAFETIQEHSKYAITSNKATSIHAVLVATNNSNDNREDDKQSYSQIPYPVGKQIPIQKHTVVANTTAMRSGTKLSQGNGVNQSKSNNNHNAKQNHQRHQSHHQHNLSLSGIAIKGREFEKPATKANMKAMAARALWHLAVGNSPICRSITESRALLCFAFLLEKGPEDVQYNSAMALMEITATAEQDTDLRRSAFKPNSPACKAVVDQLLKIIEKTDSDLLIPCIKAIGNLAKTFRATETRIIAPLVKLLDEKEAKVSREASIALTKFACTDNYLHLDHSKAIISAEGAKDLVQLVYFREQDVQISALVLLCYIALHVPDSEELAQAEVLNVLEWASKQAHMTQAVTVDTLLQEAKSSVELLSSPNSFERTKNTQSVESSFRSSQNLLTPGNFLESGLWRGQEIVSTEDALKFMEAQTAKKKKSSKPVPVVASPQSGLSSRKEKRKELEPEHSLEMTREVAQQRKEFQSEKVDDVMDVHLPSDSSIRLDLESLVGVFPQLLFDKDVFAFENLGAVSMAERGAQIGFEAMFFSWLKGKLEDSDRRASEAEQKALEATTAYNVALARSAKLQAKLDVEKAKCVRLLEETKRMEIAARTKNVELQKSKEKAEYYEDKSRSIEMFTKVKVRAELMIKFAEGKSSSWDPKADFKAWEKMKDLFSKSEKEGDLVILTEPAIPEGEKEGPSSSVDGREGM